MPIEIGRAPNGDLLWVVNPFTGTVTYLTDIHRKRIGFRSPDIAPEETGIDRDALAACPFCPGNEDHTTPEISRFPVDKSQPWQIRTFTNLFPRIPTECTNEKNESYVVVETPNHFREDAQTADHLVYTASLPRPHMRNILRTTVDLCRRSLDNPSVKAVVIRKNQGKESGASQPHPHTQVIGSHRQFTPISHEIETLEGNPNLWREILDLARSEGFIVEERDNCFLYFSPFGTFPRSYDVVDLATECRIDQVPPARLDIFADLLHQGLEILGDTPLDYEIHAEMGIPLHAHVNSRSYPYSNIAGTLNLPSLLVR